MQMIRTGILVGWSVIRLETIDFIVIKALDAGTTDEQALLDVLLTRYDHAMLMNTAMNY